MEVIEFIKIKDEFAEYEICTREEFLNSLIGQTITLNNRNSAINQAMALKYDDLIPFIKQIFTLPERDKDCRCRESYLPPYSDNRCPACHGERG